MRVDKASPSTLDLGLKKFEQDVSLPNQLQFMRQFLSAGAIAGYPK